jgi:hypothetical protein
MVIRAPRTDHEAAAQALLKPLERRARKGLRTRCQYILKTGRYELVETFPAADRLLFDKLAAPVQAPAQLGTDSTAAARPSAGP